MSITAEDGNLVIRVPMHAPTESKSGKSLTVASSGGFASGEAMVDGKPVKVNLNAIISK